MALPLVTQGELVERIAEDTGFPKGQVRHFISALEDNIAQALNDCERVKIGSMVQLEPKVKKARKARMGRNPATGEDVKIPKKPAEAVIKARVLKGAKDSTPSLNTLRRRLGG